MKTLSAASHHEFAIPSLPPSTKELFARVGAAVWGAIVSAGPKPYMAAGEMERYLSESTDTEDCARRMRAWDEHVIRQRSLASFL
ncbi:hypothetical protein [Niveibacterium sp. SC-1]|uniref:hypothetical protein n=1 Tax=Niveibacterium sp. SC-1 TaxID=3135646 RepID=UPI00311DDE5E